MRNLDFLRKRKPNALRDKTLQFAIRIVNLKKFLAEEKKEFVISKQILRSGTNPGAMTREAINAESGADFIHKLSIGQKEIAETQFWLEVLVSTNYLKEKEFISLYKDSEEILKIIRSSILTKKKKMGMKIVSFLLICGFLLAYLL